MRSRVLLAFAAAGTMLAACGGGTSSAPIQPASVPPTRQTSAMATFVVKIPPKLSTSARTAKYLTANIQGIQFSVSQANNPSAGSAFYALSAQQTYCSTPSGGGLTCTLPVVAMAGDDTFAVTTYDKPELWDANVISVGSVEKTINAQTSNTVNIVTNGVPTFFAMAVDNAFPALGTANTQPVHLLALDADANVIVGPYDVPITFTSNDISGTTQLSASSVANSTDAAAVTVSYNGGSLTKSVMFTVRANSPLAQNWNGTVPAYLHYWPGGPGIVSSPSYLLFANTSAAPQSITLTAAGATTPPFVANTGSDYFADWGIIDNLNEAWQGTSGCQGIVTVSGSSPTFTVTPVHTGYCYLNVSDSAFHPGVVPVVVQSM
jgi:hypothetical protein